MTSTEYSSLTLQTYLCEGQAVSCLTIKLRFWFVFDLGAI